MRGGAAQVDFDRLLERTSRTFALSIPRLAEPLRREVTLAYLLFRVADTLEDAAPWTPAARREALAGFAATLGEGALAPPAALVERWRRALPAEPAGDVELVAALPELHEAFRALPAAARTTIARHTVRTCEGMAGVLAAAAPDGGLELADLDALRRYCYAVAGIVGELLTELFLLHDAGLREVAGELAARAAAFGEALQLVNILKDAAADRAAGRRYLPARVDPRAVPALARRDLGEAADYVRLLERHATLDGLVEFTALPVLLAHATLDALERAGPGARLHREQVGAIVAALAARRAAGESALER